jgi:CheY-like chemotaxis protein
MIVDDESRIRDLTRMILEDAGYEVITAGNGNEAIQKIMVEMPDLVLLHILMPEMNGLEVCKVLKSDPKTNQIPIVMFTVRSRDDGYELAREAGCDGYFNKPFAPNDLVAEVEKHLTPH